MGFLTRVKDVSCLCFVFWKNLHDSWHYHQFLSGIHFYFKWIRNEARKCTSQMNLSSSGTQIDYLLHYYQTVGSAYETSTLIPCYLCCISCDYMLSCIHAKCFICILVLRECLGIYPRLTWNLGFLSPQPLKCWDYSCVSSCMPICFLI